MVPDEPSLMIPNRKQRRFFMFRKNRLFTKKGYRYGQKIKVKRK